MSQFPPPMPGNSSTGFGTAPHRGVLVLVLGILSIVLCGLLGPVAWIMGNKDMAEIDAGRMDPTGRGMTQAGKICGIVGTVLVVLGVGLWVLMMIVGIGAAAAGGGRP